MGLRRMHQPSQGILRSGCAMAVAPWTACALPWHRHVTVIELPWHNAIQVPSQCHSIAMAMLRHTAISEVTCTVPAHRHQGNGIMPSFCSSFHANPPNPPSGASVASPSHHMQFLISPCKVTSNRLPNSWKCNPDHTGTNVSKV